MMCLLDTVLRAAYGLKAKRQPRIRREHRDLVEDARAFIGLNFARRLTIAEVGRAVGASPFHLARLFRVVTGWTIHRYHTDLRLRTALGELENSDANIADIALKLGFASHSHMTKQFRTRFGTTPSQFRDGSLPDLARGLALQRLSNAT